jgi:hypothetical protein
MGAVNLPIVLVTDLPLHVLESNIRHNQLYRAWTDRRLEYIPFVPPHIVSHMVIPLRLHTHCAYWTYAVYDS